MRTAIAGRLLAELAAPITLNAGASAVVGVSIGLAHLDPDSHVQSAEELLQRADRAMYEAKRRGKGQLVSLTERDEIDAVGVKRLDFS